MKKIAGSVIVVFLVVGTMFSPWVTESFAAHRAIGSFEAKWRNVEDGCGFNCKDCGVKSSQKAPFGRKVEIEYACGLLPSDSPEYHKRKVLFVSFLGTVH